MKVSTNSKKCSACGLCADICPDIFEVRDDPPHAVVVLDNIPFVLEEDCLWAAGCCPTEAITAIEAEIDDSEAYLGT